MRILNFIWLWFSVFAAYFISAILYAVTCVYLFIFMIIFDNETPNLDIWIARQSIKFDNYAKEKSGFKYGVWE